MLFISRIRRKMWNVSNFPNMFVCNVGVLCLNSELLFDRFDKMFLDRSSSFEPSDLEVW